MACLAPSAAERVQRRGASCKMIRAHAAHCRPSSSSPASNGSCMLLHGCMWCICRPFPAFSQGSTRPLPELEASRSLRELARQERERTAWHGTRLWKHTRLSQQGALARPRRHGLRLQVKDTWVRPILSSRRGGARGEDPGARFGPGNSDLLLLRSFTGCAHSHAAP